MWQETEKGLHKEFTFKDFAEAFAFMQAVADKAESLRHHPRWTNDWNKVSIWLYTHSAQAITDKDRKFAGVIDQVIQQFPGAAEVEAGNKESVQETDESITTITSNITEVKLYADGGSRGNPGPSASGYVLFTMESETIVKKGVYLGITTNNQAEYQALKLGLEEALKRNVRVVHVYLDSLLVVNQMLGKFKVKNRDLWPIHGAIKELVGKFERVTFTHVPRTLNKDADAAVNEALDAELKV